jgi:cytochrome c oxidase subunit 2
VYRGQCAEFCGLQHADMSLLVVAQPAAAYRAWLAGMSAPAPAPAGAAAQRGAQTFMGSQCASCHQIRGTAAQAYVGPDLTHLATRSTLAAAEIPNDPSHLAAWIRDPQGIKPGSRMPDLGLSPPAVAALVTYLDGLR